MLTGVQQILGGRRTLGRIDSALALDNRIRAGLPIEALIAFAKNVGVSSTKLAADIGIAPTTYRRRCRRACLSKSESEILTRTAHIVVLGGDVFGSAQATWKWLKTPNASWAGVQPLDLLKTELGGRQVEAVIGRRLYGAYD
jgi:putative toxin-antitoxin system antitoxin component (TIGR02293 family)